MELKDGMRVRGMIVDRLMGRKSKDGLSEFIDLILAADAFFDPTTGAWEPIGDYGQNVEASYFIRSRGELNTDAVQAFADATGWDYSEEQFQNENWVPKKIQARLKIKPKQDGKGHWATFTAFAAFDATSCGNNKSTGLAETMSEFRRLKGLPTVPPAPSKPETPATTAPDKECPF